MGYSRPNGPENSKPLHRTIGSIWRPLRCCWNIFLSLASFFISETRPPESQVCLSRPCGYDVYKWRYMGYGPCSASCLGGRCFIFDAKLLPVSLNWADIQNAPWCRAIGDLPLKVIYHPLYGMNNYVLIWGDRLSCDSLRGSHDSQSPQHLCPILWQLWFICHKIIHTI